MYHPKADAWIDALQEPARQVAQACREMIMQEVPGVEERFSFGIPFYHYFGMLVYINRLKDGAIELCFCRGKDLVLAYPQLQQGKRSMVAGVVLRSLADLSGLSVRQLIAGAAHWQQEAHQMKRSFMRSPGKKGRS